MRECIYFLVLAATACLALLRSDTPASHLTAKPGDSTNATTDLLARMDTLMYLNATTTQYAVRIVAPEEHHAVVPMPAVRPNPDTHYSMLIISPGPSILEQPTP